jgi:chromosome segregation ATPase
VNREKDLRLQLKSLKDAKIRLEDVEAQLGDREGSSSGHMRREVELRKALRDAKAELDNVQAEAQEKDDQLQLLARKEKDLRTRLQRSRADDTIQLDYQTQLADADAELEVLQQRLQERERALQHSQKRETELKTRMRGLQSSVDNNPPALDPAREKRHEGELKGLAKQISFLRARCEREEGFRKGLVWTKRWFLMQVEMYNQW